MKKALLVILSVVLVLCTVFTMSGCGKNANVESDIVLITDGGNVSDGGYNESAWEGVKSFATDCSMKAMYYQPRIEEDNGIVLTNDKIGEYIKLAADKGASYIVLPGEAFAVAAYEYAPTYPDINFILLDAVPHADGDDTMHTISNVMCVKYDALQSGFLAGYTAVIQGNTKLGYIGSVNSKDSSSYGAGYVQGAAMAADEAKIPVYMSYADYDSDLLDFDYSFTVKPIYEKIENSYKECFNVTVENGYGSGTYVDGSNVTIYCDEYNKDGQKFEKWEVKSNTDGVKDKKVNLSTKSKTESNLIVGDCDCTITAVYADTDDNISTITVNNADGSVYKTYTNAVTSSGDGIWIEAPAAAEDMIFDHWITTGNSESIADINAAATNVKMEENAVVLTPVYIVAKEPTYTVTVDDGTGSGSYRAGDTVHIIADAPQEGYYFKQWQNFDSDNNGTGIAMENEFCYDTTFEMVDRYAAIAEEMIDSGITSTFAGGSGISDSLYTANMSFDNGAKIISSGRSYDGDYTCVKKEYGNMAEICLAKFTGGTIISANAANNGISMSFVSDNEDDSVSKQYKAAFDSLANGKIVLTEVAPGADVRLALRSSCLSLAYMIK